MERAIIKCDDGTRCFYDDSMWGEDLCKEDVEGILDLNSSLGFHECKRSVLYDDMTGYVDEVQDERELPDNILYIVTYFRDSGSHGSDLEQVVDFGITKQQLIANIEAQKYAEGTDYFSVEQLSKVV